MLPPEEFCFQNPPIGPPWYPAQYRDQETMLYSIDYYVDCRLDRKCRRKLANSTDLAGAPEFFQRIEAWDMLSDLCDGANILVNKRAYEKARVLLDRFFDGLELVLNFDDLSFISMFWRICLQLRGIEHRWQESEVLHRLFFAKLIGLILGQDPKGTHPLFVIASSMANVSKKDFKDTLRICYFKTVDTLLAIIGDDNSTVLHLLCLYYDLFHWGDRTHMQKDNLIKKLDVIRDRAYDSENEDAIITAEYNLAYAAHNVCGYYSVAMRHAENIFKRTSHMSFTERWTPAARAFFFSAKLLGSNYHFLGDLDEATSYLKEGIHKLDMAGNEHRIRACKLSSTLEIYFKEQKRFDEARREEARQKCLLDKIIGHNICLRCSRLGPNTHKMCGRCYMQLGQPKKPRKKRYRALGISKSQAKEIRATLLSWNLAAPLGLAVE
jgi:hypothetical protein